MKQIRHIYSAVFAFLGPEVLWLVPPSLKNYALISQNQNSKVQKEHMHTKKTIVVAIDWSDTRVVLSITSPYITEYIYTFSGNEFPV